MAWAFVSKINGFMRWGWDMDSILLYLAAGILAGRFLFPKKRKKSLLQCGRYLQAMGVCFTLFVMGITLGQTMQTQGALLRQGMAALGFAASAVAGSGAAAWLLGRWAGWLPAFHSAAKVPAATKKKEQEKKKHAGGSAGGGKDETR